MPLLGTQVSQIDSICANTSPLAVLFGAVFWVDATLRLWHLRLRLHLT